MALLYILSGADDFSLAQSLDEIKSGIGDQTVLEANSTTLDGQQLTLDQLRAVCETVPFLAERRLVVINGLLERFEPGRRPRQQNRRTRSTSQQTNHKEFSACIKEMPDSTVLVLVDNRVTGSNPLLREISSGAKIKSFNLLKDAQLQAWIKKRVSEEGGNISPQAVGLLSRLVGSNLWIMASEIDKLVLFTSGRQIEETDVKAVVSYAQEANVFAMVDAIIESKAELAEQWLQQLLQRGAPPAYLLTMLSRQVRMVVRAKDMERQRKSKAEIQSKLALTSEFVLRKTLEQASRYSLPRLKHVYQQILEADLSIKTGRYDGELALTILVAELCQRGKPAVTPTRVR